jgi:hypothetical protein
MNMPFGKYKGEDLEDIPRHYLEWCLKNIQDLRQPLRGAIEDVLEYSERPRANKTEIVRCQVQETLAAWYRRASRKYHPDHGGSNEKQIVVNDCYESLTKAIETLEVTA